MTSIQPFGTGPIDPDFGLDAQPTATPAADTASASGGTLPERTSVGGGRMGVLSSLAASARPLEERGSVGRIVSEVLSGERELDVSTAKKLIRKTVRGKSIELEKELEPLKELFRGELTMGGDGQVCGELQAGVQSTDAGRLMMESFVYNAGQVHATHGESRTQEVKGLADLAEKNALQMVSRERLGELMDLYKDTRVSGHSGIPEPGDGTIFGDYLCTHEHESNHDIESYFLGAFNKFDRHLNSAFSRFFTSEATADRLENDPLKEVREYLEGNYEPIQ